MIRLALKTRDEAVRCVRRPFPRCHAAAVADVIRNNARCIGARCIGARWDIASTLTASRAIIRPALAIVMNGDILSRLDARATGTPSMAERAKARCSSQMGRRVAIIRSTNTRSRVGIQAAGALRLAGLHDETGP